MNQHAMSALGQVFGTGNLRLPIAIAGIARWFIGLSLVLGLAVCPGCRRGPASSLHAEHAEHINEANFKEKVLDSPVPVLVDFYADWCEPCKMLAPILDEIARATPDARIARVNVDDNPGLAARYHINGVPQLMVFKNGKVVAQHLGAADRSQLESLLLRYTTATAKRFAETITR
jgi:thioredoxin 1